MATGRSFVDDLKVLLKLFLRPNMVAVVLLCWWWCVGLERDFYSRYDGCVPKITKLLLFAFRTRVDTAGPELLVMLELRSLSKKLTTRENRGMGGPSESRCPFVVASQQGVVLVPDAGQRVGAFSVYSPDRWAAEIGQLNRAP